MSSKNSQKHFTVGIGQFTPWSAQNWHVKESLTKQAPKRKFTVVTGMQWKDGKLVALKPIPDNRRVRRVGGHTLVGPMVISRGRVTFMGMGPV